MFSATQVGRRFRALALAAVASGAVIAGSAAFATPALAAYPEYHCPQSYTTEFQGDFPGVSCTIVWYNRSVAVSLNSVDGDYYYYCMTAYTNSTNEDRVCGYSIPGDTLESPGDAHEITRVVISENHGGVVTNWPVPRPSS